MVGAEQPSSVLGFSCSKSPQSAVFLGLKTSCEGGVGAQNQPKWWLLGQGRGGPVAAPSPQTLGGVWWQGCGTLTRGGGLVLFAPETRDASMHQAKLPSEMGTHTQQEHFIQGTDTVGQF